jgi:hypothetical protein
MTDSASLSMKKVLKEQVQALTFPGAITLARSFQDVFTVTRKSDPHDAKARLREALDEWRKRKGWAVGEEKVTWTLHQASNRLQGTKDNISYVTVLIDKTNDVNALECMNQLLTDFWPVRTFSVVLLLPAFLHLSMVDCFPLFLEIQTRHASEETSDQRAGGFCLSFVS